jgi:hypothetical protein
MCPDEGWLHMFEPFVRIFEPQGKAWHVSQHIRRPNDALIAAGRGGCAVAVPGGKLWPRRVGAQPVALSGGPAAAAQGPGAKVSHSRPQRY